MSFVKKLVRKYLFLSGEVISYDLSILSIPLRHHRFENFSLIIAILHPPKKKKIIIKTKGELNLKTIDPLSSQSKQIPLFSTKNRRSTIREQNSGRVYSSSHSHPLSPGQLLAPDLLRFQVEKAGGRSSREGRSWGDKRFVLVRPRSKWLFRGQESPRELKIRAIGHEGEGLAG